MRDTLREAGLANQLGAFIKRAVVLRGGYLAGLTHSTLMQHPRAASFPIWLPFAVARSMQRLFAMETQQLECGCTLTIDEHTGAKIRLCTRHANHEEVIAKTAAEIYGACTVVHES